MGNAHKAQEQNSELKAKANPAKKTNLSTANSTEQWLVELVAVSTEFFEKTTLQTQKYLGNATSTTGAICLQAGECQQKKLHPQTTAPVTAEMFQQKSLEYWQFARQQQQVMDQILAQMILASDPDFSGSDLIPELEQAHLSSEAVKAIATYLEKPIPLENLLEQLPPDFAAPVFAQCQRIAQINGDITPQSRLFWMRSLPKLIGMKNPKIAHRKLRSNPV